MTGKDDNPQDISYRIQGVKRKRPMKSDPPQDKRAGAEFITSMLMFCAVGALIDRALHTFPWGFLVLTVCGLGLSIWNFRREKMK